MNTEEIKQKIKSGELIAHSFKNKDGRLIRKVYTKLEWEMIQKADALVDHFDLLQLTKKIQLKMN